MNVFTYTTYKEFLKDYISRNEARGLISQLAAACGCDRTYISQVLNGKAELTPDHMIQLCEHLGFKESESNYLLLLLLRDRSASQKARASLEGRIRQIRGDALTVSEQVINQEKTKTIREEERTRYYSSWLYGAIHILTSIEAYQTPSAIAAKLHLPVTQVTQILKELMDMGAVALSKGRHVHTGQVIFLDRKNPQIVSQHFNWRMKAIERAMMKDEVHYTLAFSVSEKDVEKLRLQILELIEKQRKLIHSSGAEVACAICMDFFPI